jgi:hypothetical protein
MSSATSSRKRALAQSGSVHGRVRHSLYSHAYARIKDALAHGFYLEAITLAESLVSDRLEHRLTFLKKHDFSFKTLGKLISEIRTIESDQILKDLVLGPLDKWRDKRNGALHEMAKIADGDHPTWEARMTGLEVIAKNGLATLRAVDRRCKQLRRAGK